MKNYTGQRNLMPGYGLFTRMPSTMTARILTGVAVNGSPSGGAAGAPVNFDPTTGNQLPTNPANPINPSLYGPVVATSVSASEIDLNGGLIGVTPSSYVTIYRSTTNSFPIDAAHIIFQGLSTTTPYKDTGLASSTTYYYYLIFSDSWWGYNTYGYISATTSSSGSNLIPAMTSNTTPSGVASANSNNGTAWQGISGVSPFWTSVVLAGSGTAVIQYQFAAGHVVSQYTINYSPMGRHITAVLAGSNDGSSFTAIDSQTFTSSGGPFTIGPITISSPQSYSYYRLTLTNLDNNAWQAGIRQMILFGI